MQTVRKLICISIQGEVRSLRAELEGLAFLRTRVEELEKELQTSQDSLQVAKVNAWF